MTGADHLDPAPGIPRWLAAPALVLCAVCAGCSSESAGATSANQQLTAAQVEEVSDTSLVIVPHPALFPVTPVELRALPDRLGGTCVVTPDVNRSVPVNALGGGRVVELRATLGDAVRRGQILVVINSPDLAAAIASYQKAVADELLARRQLERSRVLFDHGSIARKDLESAEDSEDKAQVDLRTTADQVRLLGGNPDHPSSRIELAAPISGTIVQQGVAPGAGVKSPDNAPNLFTIADLSHVWVLCDVYENDLPRVQTGEMAQVRLNAYPDHPFRGRVGNISPLLDSTTRTAKVRIELDNPAGVMRLGMFATAEFQSRTSRPQLVIPASAILRLHDADWVFVKAAAGRFRRVQIASGPVVPESGHNDASYQEVLSGLARGDSVVRNALQFAQASARE